MIATHALADRGINIDNIYQLIFWDLPKTLEVYKCALGRVGRLGNVGKSLAFTQKGDIIMQGEMRKFLMMNKQQIPTMLEASTNAGWDNSASGNGGNVDKSNTVDETKVVGKAAEEKGADDKTLDQTVPAEGIKPTSGP